MFNFIKNLFKKHEHDWEEINRFSGWYSPATTPEGTAFNMSLYGDWVFARCKTCGKRKFLILKETERKNMDNSIKWEEPIVYTYKGIQ